MGNPKFVAKLDRNGGSLGPHLWVVFDRRAVFWGTVPLNLWDLMQILGSVRNELNRGYLVTSENWCRIITSHLVAEAKVPVCRELGLNCSD